MALQVSLSSLQYNQCEDWILTDNAGTYSGANTDGWATSTSGGTNLRVDNSVVLCAELIVTMPSGTQVTIDIISNWADLTGLANVAFDSSTTPSSLIYTVNALTYFGVDTFPDGIYEVVYRVGDAATYETSSVRSSVTYKFASYCSIECCIEQRLATVPTEYTCESCSNAY